MGIRDFTIKKILNILEKITLRLSKMSKETNIPQEAPTVEVPEFDISKCYTNRELSWLKFNERVLDEAGNPKVPLAERLSFASIFQTNLDEFFMVRVGTLMVQMQAKKQIRDTKTNMTSKEQVEAILNEVDRLEKKKAKIYEQLMGELEPKGARIINFSKLSNDEGKFLEKYFDAHIAPFLTPWVLGKQQPFPFLANKQLYAIVLLSTQKEKRRIGIVPCSNSVFKRLIEIPTRPGNFMLSEELILHFIGKIFPQYNIVEKSILRVTRNADIDALEANDEDMNYRDVMEILIKKRSRLNPVRIELSRKLNSKVKKEVADYLKINTNHILHIKTPLDLSFVFELQNYLSGKPELFYDVRKPQLSRSLNLRQPIIPQIVGHDVLLAYPFESMQPFLQMLLEAANDDSVVSIKMTLYRVASHSKIIDLLIDAAENGKEVVVLLELRARFDEANNIDMSKRLEEAGCHIMYGLEKYKVHSKLCLISRKIEGSDTDVQYITQIGTGNYNEKTARLYTDLSIITADQKIGAETAAIFTALQQHDVVHETEHLLVAPNCLQNRIADMIDEQIGLAKSGQSAYIGIKINSLTDKYLINKLISASRAGVRIELIVRGICCLIPGIPGATENIRVVSVVGRYLEHSRIYIFGTGVSPKIYISSADLMTRNTTRRVEVAVPIYDPEIKKRLIHIFNTAINDDEKGKELLSDGMYHDIETGNHINSQEVLFRESYGE